LFEQALQDLQVAVKLCPTNPDVKKLMSKVSDDFNSRSNSSTLKTRETREAIGLVKIQASKPRFMQSQSNLIESPPL
jgi:hypothetical protein